MSPRLDFFAKAPDLMQSMVALNDAVVNSGLEHSLVELVKLRASQINGCAFCIDMHTADARRHGESEQRLYLLSAWWESSLFSARERAALAWTEALTQVAESRVPDSVYEPLKAQFSEEEQVRLSLLIVIINGWNRLAVAFRSAHPVRQPRAVA